MCVYVCVYADVCVCVCVDVLVAPRCVSIHDIDTHRPPVPPMYPPVPPQWRGPSPHGHTPRPSIHTRGQATGIPISHTKKDAKTITGVVREPYFGQVCCACGQYF